MAAPTQIAQAMCVFPYYLLIIMLLGPEDWACEQNAPMLEQAGRGVQGAAMGTPNDRREWKESMPDPQEPGADNRTCGLKGFFLHYYH